MTVRKTMLALAMLALAWSIGPLFAADPRLAAQQSAAEAETRMETLSGDSVSSATYNKGLAKKSHAYYCGTGTCDTAPALLNARAPVYPPGALAAGTEGRAAVLFDIDAQGMPQNITLQSATAAEFVESALEAVKSWRFRPATFGGKPVQFQRALQLFPFELRD
jgi:TonB family protein